MDKLQIKGRWHEIKGKIKKAYADLSESDLNYTEGSEEEFLGKLEQKTGKRRKELVKWINSL